MTMEDGEAVVVTLLEMEGAAEDVATVWMMPSLSADSRPLSLRNRCAACAGEIRAKYKDESRKEK